MNKLEAIEASKQFRKDMDEVLQRMKAYKLHFLASGKLEGEVLDYNEFIAQHTLSIRDLESAIMRQGMVLKNIGNPNPYPESYDPKSPTVAPTSDGLKL